MAALGFPEESGGILIATDPVNKIQVSIRTPTGVVTMVTDTNRVRPGIPVGLVDHIDFVYHFPQAQDANGEIARAPRNLESAAWNDSAKMGADTTGSLFLIYSIQPAYEYLHTGTFGQHRRHRRCQAAAIDHRLALQIAHRMRREGDKAGEIHSVRELIVGLTSAGETVMIPRPPAGEPKPRSCSEDIETHAALAGIFLLKKWAPKKSWVIHSQPLKSAPDPNPRVRTLRVRTL